MTVPKKYKIYSTVKLGFSRQMQVKSKVIISCETFSVMIDFLFYSLFCCSV